MKLTFEKRFLKDLQKIKEKEVKLKIKEIITNLKDCDFFFRDTFDKENKRICKFL